MEPNYPGAETEKVVYQEMEADEVEGFAAFLRYLVDHYGPQTSRYSPKRICVRVEPSDKFEPPQALSGLNRSRLRSTRPVILAAKAIGYLNKLE